MSETHSDTTIRRFKLKAAPSLVMLEIVILLFIAVSAIALLSMPWNLVFLLLLGLTGYRFFRKDSVIQQYDEQSALEINPADLHLTWINHSGNRNFPADQVKIRMTRWFILLQLGHGCSFFQCLLVTDSFENSKLYAECRRILKRAEHAG